VACGSRRVFARSAALAAKATLLDGDELRVQGASADQIGELASDAGIALHELVQESSTLEKIFLELTSGSEP
jgi:hypothetical protein